ncbi:MAG TPA: diguanylate cyclase [Longimicrobiales bacterium]|nr:diguanylate cyclase [Longimicrobiales bacterium]
MQLSSQDTTSNKIPSRTLLLSLGSLLVPVLSSVAFPNWTSDDIGMLIWVLALAPAFLLSYEKGWRGSGLALAATMATLSLGQAILLWNGATPPSPQIILGALVVLLTVTLGSGWLSAMFHATLDKTERLALTDPGTALPNRRHATIHLDRAFAAARRGVPLSVIAFDLDHFKSVNDRFGHATGDRVLVDFADLLKARTRGMTLSARIGGEEFISILDGEAAEGAAIFANSILADLRQKEYPWGSQTASAGIAEYEPGMVSPDVLLAAADQALYRAKQAGRDRVSVMARLGRRKLEPRASGAPVPTAVTRPRGAGERILVIDDEPTVLRLLGQALHGLGYSVLEASEPEQALQIFGSLHQPVDLVLTDVVMPSMSGFRLVEVLEEQQSGVRVLYMSGYDDTDVDWAGVPGAVRGFLQKPIELDVLATTVRQALDEPTELAALDPVSTTPVVAKGQRR